MDLIDRQALLKQIDIDSDGEPGYYGDTWKFIDTIKSMPSATDTNVGTKLSTNLAEVGTDTISRQDVIDALRNYLVGKNVPCDGTMTCRLIENEVINKLPSAQPTFDARDTQYNLPIGTDLISRQQAIDALRKKQDNGKGDISRFYNTIIQYDIEAIEQLPSAQPDIIRCRNCKFASGDSRICMKLGHSPIGELDFCSFAERREENNESN